MRKYNPGLAIMKEIEKIEAIKIGKSKKTKVSLYYKDIDGKIKPVNGNIIDKKFLDSLRERYIQKYGEENYIPFYINENILGENIEFLHLLIDGEDLTGNNEGEYIEVPIKKVNNIKIIEEENDYIKFFYISANNLIIKTAYEIKKIGGEAIISS